MLLLLDLAFFAYLLWPWNFIAILLLFAWRAGSVAKQNKL